MSGGVVFVFFAVALVVVAWLGYRSWQQDQKRRAMLMQWATANGWTFAVEDDGWVQRWQGHPFDEGDHRRACNVMTGAFKDRPFSAFDYSFQTHTSDGRGGRSTTTHHYAVVALGLPTYLPALQVTPENLLTRLGNAVGVTDIELESEDFNRAFRVHGSDQKFACDVLSPRTMQLLLSRPHYSWRIEGGDVVCWQEGKLAPADVLGAAQTMTDVVNGIPTFVWHDHGVELGSTATGGAAPP